MPYTPPAQQSPAGSSPSSPALSRSHSYLSPQSLKAPVAINGRPPTVTRTLSSSAYMSMRRRSPSASQLETHTFQPSSPLSKTFSPSENGTPKELDPHRSLRQSPPPVTETAVPSGAIISPPDSSHNSSDDEDASRGRGRQLENLGELREAIRNIDQRREGSPNGDAEDSDDSKSLELIIPEPQKATNSAVGPIRPPLSKEARKISHSRSTTESSIVLDLAQQTQSPLSTREGGQESDEEVEDHEHAYMRRKPLMVRKKSGELVRPALRPASAKKRPSSMPGTPTYSKAVHFDSELEHVRHFLAVDKPLAVSAGSSPVETYDSEVEFPFGSDDSSKSRSPYVWEISLSNFPSPSETERRKSQPVRLERVYLSSDNQKLIGAVAVQNLAFRKTVAARFTFDYWKTTSEVLASYTNDVRRKQTQDGCDRFNFCIALGDQTNLENKTMFFCVRYEVNGQTFWDSNGTINYQVQFTKKPKTYGRNGMPGLGARPLEALPRSRGSLPMSAGADQRTRSTAQSFDDFAEGLLARSSSSAAILDPPIKLKKPPTRAEMVPDAPTRRHKANGQAFGNRYDFGASLSATLSSPSNERNGSTWVRGGQPSSEPAAPSKASAKAGSSSPPHILIKAPTFGQAPGSPDPSGSGKPSALVSEKPALQSQSYKELVDKYCFYGTAKTSPQFKQSTLGQEAAGREDQMAEQPSPSISDVSTNSTESTVSSPDDSPEDSPADSPPMPESRSETPRPMSPSARPASPSSPRTRAWLGPRPSSPDSFGYPFHQLNQGLFESHAPAYIRG